MDKKQFRILVVDDGEDILDLYRQILIPPQTSRDSASFLLSFALTLCEKAEEAVQATREAIEEKDPFALVFMDVFMPPGPDGVWAAEQIRRIDPSVGIVLVTGHLDVELGQIEQSIPPPDRLLYINKPFNPKEIWQIAICMCAKWEGEKELRTIYAHLDNQIGEQTSALRETNKRLQDSEESFRNTIINNADGVIILDKNLAVGFMNPAAELLFGRKLEKIIGEPFGYPVVAGESTEIDIVRGNKDSAVAEMRLTETIWKGEKAYIASLRNVTEKKRMREALQKSHDELERRVKERTAELTLANQAKSDFLANMSHELRTPLNAIIGFSEVLEDRIFGDLNKKQTRYIRNIVESSRHLHQVINDILDLSKVEAGRMALEPSQVKINDLLENSLIMIREKAARHKITLDLDAPDLPSGFEITADERKLKQIMYNLLSNAIKFTRDGGRVRIKAKLISDLEFRISELEEDGKTVIPGSDLDIQDSSNKLLSEQNTPSPASNLMSRARVGRNPQAAIEISVVDTGIGINPEDLARVFREFEQLYSSYNREYEGTGLGLALTRRFVEMHGGRIWVESEGQGKGCTFTFAIPTGEL